MSPLAHIGNIPVEEWLPFVVPVVVLYVIGRRATHRRREAVRSLPEASELLDQAIIERVVARWTESRHGNVAARHLPIFYPPGPDGLTATQLAARARCKTSIVEELLHELEELGYIEYAAPSEPVSLTVEGYDLLTETEAVLLETAREQRAREPNPV